MLAARRLLAVLAFGLLLVAGWSFAANHGTRVTLDFWLGQWSEVPLWLALCAAFAAGAVLVGLFAGWGLARARLERRRYRSSIAGLESELHQLRNLPLAAEAEGAASEARDEPQPPAAAAPAGRSAEGRA